VSTEGPLREFSQAPLPGTSGALESDDIASEVALSSPDVLADSLGEYARIWLTRVRNGDSGALPVILGLVVIVIYFQARSSLFLSAGNLVNLAGQAAWIAVLGMAEVFVLLLGEIDLSIGYTAPLGATFTCWLLLPPHPAPWPLAVLVGLAVPAIFSGLQGLIVTRLRLPSFVVTLAGQLLALGLLLEVMDSAAPNGGGTIRLYPGVLADIYSGSLSPVAGWIVMAAAVAGAGALFLVRDSRRRASNLTAPPLSVTLLKIAAIAVAGVIVVLVGNTNRGGLTAGIMGIIYTSYLGSVSTGVQGGQLVLLAVAAGVIGGTSLFGGRGKMVGALLGGLIVAVIYNGLELLGLGAAPQYIWTAVVLLAAVTVDTLARRRSTTA